MLVEGAGGWLTPVANDATIADLCVALALPVIVVAANRLGCISHTLLTIECLRTRQLECLGIILNTIRPQPNEATRTNRALLEEFSDTQILFEIAPGQNEIVPPSAWC